MDQFMGTQAVPSIIYGTAFKDDDTAMLVETALKIGFRAIDTSGNRPQYREALVGQGIAASVHSGVVKRSDLYVQTKFSPYRLGKDPSLYPYDTTKSIPEQVQQSVSSSLASLRVDHIDCLILHSLYPDMADTITAWRALEALVPSKVSSLGLSNVDAQSLREVWHTANVKPNSAQNRFTGETSPQPDSNMPPGLPYPAIPYDRDVRSLCESLGVTYVPWGLLWGNAAVLDHDPNRMLEKTVQEIGVSKQAAWYACFGDLAGCRSSILCGTTKEETMRMALADLSKLDDLLKESESHRTTWAACTNYIGSILVDTEPTAFLLEKLLSRVLSSATKRKAVDEETKPKSKRQLRQKLGVDVASDSPKGLGDLEGMFEGAPSDEPHQGVHENGDVQGQGNQETDTTMSLTGDVDGLVKDDTPLSDTEVKELEEELQGMTGQAYDFLDIDTIEDDDQSVDIESTEVAVDGKTTAQASEDSPESSIDPARRLRRRLAELQRTRRSRDAVQSFLDRHREAREDAPTDSVDPAILQERLSDAFKDKGLEAGLIPRLVQKWSVRADSRLLYA
ncbi:hypothetical protein PRZ48_007626 [Zasmidium cellare]|uniref:NADP-dependent oxidoreductase domain-containing protein n=1 Tax=Zasmidium cellare TaxID=395010 RepID=A0ABR0EJU5_ZASCE|nr:hypothetical protein PRZ48_007626 [Zasmidium cellare]